MLASFSCSLVLVVRLFVRFCTILHLSMFLGTALKRLISLVFSFVIFTCVMEYVPSNGFITRFRAAVSVLVGLCCPALPSCIDADVHAAVLLGK